MTLFSDPADLHSHRVRLVLAEKHVTTDIVDVDPLNLPEDVMDLNPYGTAPTLVDRDLVLFDSRIILEYLDERYPHPPLLPVDPVSRATFRMYMYRVEQDWYSKVNVILGGGKPATKARKELKESLIASAPIVEAKPFFMSDEFSVVDASIAPLLWRLPYLGIELENKASNIFNAYAARLFKREAFAQSLTEAEREMRL
ncbi:glutathione S-transferase N-terminal domain-containing protein [Thiolapillus brandeum]|uniref:Stringent starvation protein A n=1 Tax=Thiolapillus brandeum TaxID=1076588 RepID=A0A7U6JH20_9GAMM|nr:glutathione S-transferase N-terminal domain-containing protein [Thiolapillus brandeum]BAO43402.1 stringent starvation protein A [Thiolapillus brandeum]